MINLLLLYFQNSSMESKQINHPPNLLNLILHINTIVHIINNNMFNPYLFPSKREEQYIMLRKQSFIYRKFSFSLKIYNTESIVSYLVIQRNHEIMQSRKIKSPLVQVFKEQYVGMKLLEYLDIMERQSLKYYIYRKDFCSTNIQKIFFSTISINYVKQNSKKVIKPQGVKEEQHKNQMKGQNKIQ
ncbi:hypothetical protein pb186bvf_002536 [Paramecium bursaria]